MRSIVTGIAGAVIATFCAAAEGPEGYAEIYNEPTRVNLGGRWVEADIALYTDEALAAEGDLRLALVTDVTKFIDETEQDLENWVAARQARCGQRWAAGEPLIEFPRGAIRFVLDLELEVWQCGWNGKAEPALLTREAGRVDVALDPYVEDGRLQAQLVRFVIDQSSGVTQFLPLQYIVRQIVEAELRRLNDNPKFYRAPQPLHGEHFVYESITAEKPDGERVVITARYRAEGDRAALNRVTEKLREEGLTQ